MKKRPKHRLLSLLLALVMTLTAFPLSAAAEESGAADSSLDYRIVHLDSGRKYFSVDNIKAVIDNAANAGFNYVELAFGNDGLRFLLDDMSVSISGVQTVDEASEKTVDTQGAYSTEAVTEAIQAANKTYYDAGDKNELTQAEMDEIIAYANEKGVGIIPLFNTPGHMNAVVSAMATLGIDGDYNDSANTIDVTNETAVAFTKALLQKYINYFAGKGCKVFNIGADEYANDIYSTGGMGFAQLISAGQYDEFVTYVNELAAMVKTAGMTPMAFNDGIYYNSNTTTAIDTDILVAYWTCGWSGYNVTSASFLKDQGFQLINTHGDYYWVLGKTNAQCSAEKAAEFDADVFMGDTSISDPAGAMFCIWCDVPDADTADNVVADTAPVIAAFGGALTDAGESEDTTPETVTSGDVSVTAPGLTEVTATETTAPEIDGASAVVAYDITPKTANGAYTGEATVTLPVPSDWTNVKGGVLASDNGEQVLGIEGTRKDGKFTFTVPHFSTVVVYDENATNDTPQEVSINVVAGETATSTITGANLSNETPEITDNSVVTDVTVTGTDAQEATVTYTEANDVTCADLLSSNSNTWQNTGYYYLEDGNYYPLYAQRSYRQIGRNYYYCYLYGYSTTNSANDVTRIGDDTSQNQVVTDVNTAPDITVYSKSGTEATPASTTVTFTAAADAAGKSTTVTIGTVVYTVNVVAVDLSAVEPLTIEYWITNARVTGSDSQTSVNVAAASANSESGVAISELVPATGTHANNETVYWKARRLPDAYRQTAATAGGVDRCTDENGTDITHVRYWDGKWEYSSNGTTWTEVLDNDQIVAYYMQKSTVTDEVTTVFVDYGVERASWGDAGWLDGKYVRLDFAVRYPSGERVPDSFSTDKSLLYHCDNVGPYRTLKPIRGLETAEYEIYLITLTPTSDDIKADFGNDTASTQTYSYDGTEKVAWAKTQDDLDNSGMEEWTSISGMYTCAIGGDPDLQAIEIYNLQGMRVTYYLRAKVTEDSLTVNYYDTTAGNAEFYSYNIAVNSGTVFDENIALNTANWKGDLVNGTVTNSNNRTQTVSADLSTLPELSKAYTDRDYTCTQVTRSEDGKVVNLYYTFENMYQIVYDYGKPITVTAADMSLGNASAIELKDGYTPKYGDVQVNDDKSVTYTPNTLSPKVEEIPLTCTYETEGQEDSKITAYLRVIPATSVYYETDFADGVFTLGSTWNTEGTASEEVQDDGTIGVNQTYGYDSTYTDDTSYSNGSSYHIEGDKTKDAEDCTTKASFTFTGTGFDLISRTGEEDGQIRVTISNASGTVKTVKVLNKSETELTLYQIPVVSVNDLAYGTYNVLIEVYKGTTYSGTLASLSRGNLFYFDAVRIYNPVQETGYAASAYQMDGEADATVTEIRSKILDQETYDGGSEAVDNTVVFVDRTYETDENGAVKATGVEVADYETIGPNNEVYLAKGQGIAFQLTSTATPASIDIGAKSANGAPVTLNASLYSKDNNYSTSISEVINSCTAQNYNLMADAAEDGVTTETILSGGGAYVVIFNDGNGVLSLTDLKVAYGNTSGVATLAGTPEAVEAAGKAMSDDTSAEEQPEEQPNYDILSASFDSETCKLRKYATMTVITTADVVKLKVVDYKNREVSADITSTTENNRTTWKLSIQMTNAGTRSYTVTGYGADTTAGASASAEITVTRK